jgi:hypothetical protein
MVFWILENMDSPLLSADEADLLPNRLSNIFADDDLKPNDGSLLATLDELLFGWLLWFIDIMFALLLLADLGADCVEPGAWLDGLFAEFTEPLLDGRLLAPLSLTPLSLTPLSLDLLILLREANSAKFKLPKLFPGGGDLLVDVLFALMFSKIGSIRTCGTCLIFILNT